MAKIWQPGQKKETEEEKRVRLLGKTSGTRISPVRRVSGRMKMSFEDFIIEALKAAYAAEQKEVKKWQPVPVKTAPIAN